MKRVGGRRAHTLIAALIAGVAVVIGLAGAGTPRADAAPIAGFAETVAFSGLVNPTVVRFASDGRVFVAEKSGLIKVFDGLGDPTPTTFADLRTNVHNFWDRGLLGLALAPSFPTDPSVYVLYTHDAAVGGTAPRWGTAGAVADGCPTPPGANGDGCVVSGRLSRLQATGNTAGPEQVMIEDWCQQYPSHSVGGLAFGADGALYVSAGDGASFTFTDYGQDGNPVNPCGDPPGGVGATLAPPTAEGGALRSQDVRTSGDPTSLDGAILRLDPATGAALPDNPLAFSSDPNARRVIAHGFRNPFRITVRPGTSEIWSGDVGWNDWEELNIAQNQADGVADNYGWPCYEGNGRQAGYDGANLTICETLFGEAGAVVSPYFTYNHTSPVVTGDTCATGSSSISGLAFETGTSFPSSYDGALFFADYSRDCIWVMRAGADGRPNVATRAAFVPGASNPVDLTFGPDGALYYADFDGGTIRRVASTASDTTPPTVSVTAPSAGSTVTGTTVVTASASDNSGVVSGVQFRLDGVDLGVEDTSSPFSFTWDSRTATNGQHTITAVARDPAGNSATSAPVTVTVSNSGTPPPVGLVAAYGFDEGSGTTAADASGAGNTGTIAGPAWAAAGRYGRALAFDGVNDWVSVADSPSLQLSTGMTLEAWVKPSALGGWRTVVLKEDTSFYAYALYADSDSSQPTGNAVIAGNDTGVRGTAALPLDTWTHLATTYDGANLRLYRNGVLESLLPAAGSIVPSTGALRIGGTGIWPEWFQGLIDEVRVYNRALAATELQSDMTRPVSQADTQAPGAPGTLAATGGLGSVALTWGAATDDTGVVRYNVHRGAAAGFTPSAANRVAQPAGTSYTDTGLAAGTYYYRVTAEDAAGNVGPPSNEASAVVTTDSQPPSVSVTAPSAGSTVSGTVTVTAAASDNGTVAGVRFRLDGVDLGAEDTTAPYSTPWNTTLAANGSHTLTAVARDGAGNTATSTAVIVTVSNATPTGLVAAYGFDEGAGTAAADASGSGNAGTIAGPTWTASGKYGAALTFDGTNDWVTVADAASLDLTTAVTMEAWVYPTVLTDWRTVLFKEQTGNLVYGLYANRSSGRPNAQAYVAGADRNVDGTGLLLVNTWSHLAATYDGAALRLYVNGTQVAQVAQTGAIATSTGALRIGGNSLWSEWFAGRIDEVRLYNRALTAAQIQSDMNTPVTGGNRPPTAVATGSPLTGPAPLAVTFSGGGSSDPDPGDTLSYAWDLDGDGQYDDSTAVSPTRTYTSPGTVAVRLRVTDGSGATSESTPVTVTAQNTAPVVTITAPSAGTTWRVDDLISFAATATDAQDGTLPPTALDWAVIIQHCPSNCHTHTYETFSATATGSFPAPDHEYPTYLQLRVTATDANGASSTATLDLHPETVDLTFRSEPSGMQLVVGATAGTTPFARTVIVGSANSVSAPTPQSLGSVGYVFDAWSDGGAQSHVITAPAAAATYTATYVTGGTPPSVAITAPTGGTVSGTVPVAATASDDGTVAGVRFTVDGAQVGSEDTTSPYGISWDTTSVANGSHTLRAIARDNDGIETTSAPVAVTVTNNRPPTAVATGSPLTGPAPLTVTFDGSGSSDPDPGDTLTYAWDLNGDGQYDDSSAVSPSRTYTTAGTVTVRLRVTDGTGAASVSAPLTVTVQQPATGLVAAYGFEEASGAGVVDSSGTGNAGTITGATRVTTGRYGNALSFNGSSNWVTVPDAASLDLTTGMTVEAWVYPTALSGWRTVVMKQGSSGNQVAYDLYANRNTNVPAAEVRIGSSERQVNGTTQLPLNTWTHLAATYDGTTFRIFVNGTQVGSLALSGAMTTSAGVLRIGGNSLFSEWFAGRIDEVRIYSRALTATELQADMTRPVVNPDSNPPGAPGSPSAAGGLASVALQWSAASDDTGVVRYNVHRATASGFTPSAANRVAQPTGTSYTDTGLAAGTYYFRVTAEDAAGNVGPPSAEVSGTATADTTPPTVSVTAPSAGATVSGTTTLTASANDNAAVAGVQFRVDGSPVGAEDTSAPYSYAWNSATVANGPHTITAVARDAAGNQTTSSAVSVTVSNTVASGLVAAYGFEEGSGTTTADASGNGNAGTIAGAAWTASGRNGKALSFNGSSDWVTVADSNSLDVTSAVTMEAWVYPTLLTGWRTVLFKEQAGNLVYGLYANRSSGRPNGQVFVAGADRNVDGTALLPLATWTHLAATYDGTTLRLYVNGIEVGQVPQAGPVATSSGALRIGGNSVWSEWFAGVIDDVRIYNRALTPAELQADMNRPVP